MSCACCYCKRRRARAEIDAIWVDAAVKAEREVRARAPLRDLYALLIALGSTGLLVLLMAALAYL